MQRRLREVAAGQLYKKVGAGGGTWEVVAVRADASGSIHARLKSVEDGKTFRTFAIGALTDTKNFQPIEDR